MSKYQDVKERVSLKEYAEHVLSKKGKSYVCPCCGSGTKQNGTPAFSITTLNGKEMWKCFSCDEHGDIFDLAGIVNDTKDDNERLRIVADFGNIDIGQRGGFKDVWGERSKSSTGTATADVKTDKEEKGTDTPENDYSTGRERHRRYVAECARRLKEQPTDEIISYLSARGITYDNAVMLGIGYDPKPKHGWQDENGKWFNTPRIVIPWVGSDYYHIDRAIDDRAHDLKYDKPPNEPKGKTPIEECVGEQPIYNPQAFDHDYIVVVEGALDAIAVHLCGYNVIALGGTSLNSFANEAKERNYSGVIIEMLDADGELNEKGEWTKGRGAGIKLIDLLEKAGITCLSRAEYGVTENTLYGYAGTVTKGYKDAGEWYAADPQYMKDFMSWAVKKARDKAQSAKDAEYREALKNFHVKDPATVADDVLTMRDVYEPVPTGITSLDEKLDGGLNLGELTIFGAVSSYGKTTLAVQIADFIASSGHPVLFVTMEQSAKELTAKSLSRLVYTENVSGYNVLTPTEVTSLRKRKALMDGQNEALNKAVDDYKRMIAPKLLVLESVERPTVKNIMAVALKMKEHDGQAPIIFIDYLQLLAPLSERYDDKKNTDINVSELRKMARDLNTHIWCISSLNRENYTNGVTMTAFKESGSIEFGSDNLMGLQMRGMYDIVKKSKGSDAKIKRDVAQLLQENKQKKDRPCEIVILKRRNGALPDEALPLTFKTMSSYFMEPL